MAYSNLLGFCLFSQLLFHMVMYFFLMFVFFTDILMLGLYLAQTATNIAIPRKYVFMCFGISAAFIEGAKS